ncbi:MAG: sugar nucleotide-binding protein [Nitrospinae bacterium]|nr:sugar nucleotide-binding protein [Nitrospinota bacterium]
MSDLSYLVAGAGGLIGSSLFEALKKSGAQVAGTTRRKERTGTGLRFLDLADGNNIDIGSGRCSVAFLCAGITSLAACEADPGRTRLVNVTNTLLLARKLLGSGAKVVFLSSNAVFDGGTPHPDENCARCPVVEYGRQKAEVEEGLLSMGGGDNIIIVRITKTLSARSGMASEFLKHLQAGNPCMAFTDLLMSPISLGHVTGSLLAIASSGLSGIFHVSGSEELSYADFAGRLAASIGADPSLVRQCSSSDAGVKVLFSPRYPALGMERTSGALGIPPEPLEEMLANLSGEN